MRVLLTGGTGMISSAIARDLLSDGNEVVLFHREMSQEPGFETAGSLTGDRHNASEFVRQVRGAGVFDCVIDMICYTPGDAASLVEAAKGRAGHVILCSTVDVYAKPASRYPITEGETRKPMNEYGRGKAACENILTTAAGPNFKVTIIRPAHTYGPGGRRRGNFVHAFGSSTQFLDRLRRGKPVIVPGDGSALRGSSHVDDVSRAFVSATHRVPDALRVCHVTSEEWLTWDRYHQVLAELLSAPEPTLVHIPTKLLARIAPTRAARCPENYQFNGIYDNSVAQRELGFRYTIPFAQGARETLAWVEQTGGLENSDEDPFYDAVIAEWRAASDELENRLKPLER